MRTRVYTRTATVASWQVNKYGQVLPALYAPFQIFIEDEKDMYMLHRLL